MFQVLLPADKLAGGRAAVMQLLKENGIGTGVHYPALHLFSYYRQRGWREGMLPQAEGVGRSTLTLPLFPQLSPDDVYRICQQLAESCKQLLK
jgi:dTDP-4-amino-4,6-dideoxygalactose transaminase